MNVAEVLIQDVENRDLLNEKRSCQRPFVAEEDEGRVQSVDTYDENDIDS